MVVGITGKYCAGKSTLVPFLAELGFSEINVDKIGHEVLAHHRSEVIERFGIGVVLPDGAIDRSRLAGIVFKNAHKRRQLEEILHPAMVRRVQDELGTLQMAVIHAAILIPMGLHRLCNLVICVRAPLVLRVLRALRRDRISLVGIVRRNFAQRRICPKSVRSEVDTIYVCNRISVLRLKKRVARILARKGLDRVSPWNDKSYC